MKASRVPVWLAALGVALLVSACRGGGEESPPDEEAPVLEASATPAPFLEPGTTLVPQAGQSTLDVIRQRGEWRVGVLYNNPPFSHLTDGGVLEGFEVELVQAMADSWGIPVSFVQVTHQTGIPYLLAGQVGMLASGVPHRRELHELVDFSQTVFRSGYLMLVLDGSTVESLTDLDLQPVGIVEEASFDALATRAREAGVSPTAGRYDTTQEAVEALLAGRVTAVVGRREALMLATQTNPEVRILDDFLEVEPYAFAVLRGDSNYRNLIDVTLQGLVANGTYAALFGQYFYGFAADQPIVWPGEVSPSFSAQPATLDLPSESRVASVARGESLTLAGLESVYDDPELDGQRLLDDFNRALVNEIARRWGVSFDEVSGGDGGAAAVAAGQADLAVGVVPNRDLAAGADYSQVYLERAMRLVRPADVAVESIDDLDSQSVAVLGSPEDANLLSEDNANVQFLDVTSSRHALSLLQSQAASVVMADEWTVGLMARQEPTLVVLEGTYNPVPYVMAVPRYDSDFRALVNFTLQDIYADGTLGRLARQYFGPYAPEGETVGAYPVEVWPGSPTYLGLSTLP